MSDDDDFAMSEEDEEDFAEFDSDDGSAMDDELDVVMPTASVSREEENKPECLTPADLIRTQLQHIEEVNTIFQISPGTARILLAHFNWDKERLVERYYDGDQDKLFREAQVVNPHEAKTGAALTTRNPETEVTCEICYVDSPVKEMTGLDCGHTFCQVCWEMYLKTKIADDGTQVIECPELDCPILVDELTVTRLIKDPLVLKKYEYLVAKAFVQGNKHVVWCPSPGCDNAVRLPIVESRPVKCNCGFNFCFGCGESAHEPIRCEMLKVWLKKCADDSETSNWIAANTKECPKCRSAIEKNGGCNHMACRTPTCKYEFCWVCMGPWEPHGSAWYNCNRFDEKDSVEARQGQKKSRVALERYLFYFNRYANHDQSAKLEGKLQKLVQRKQREMQEANMSWIEVQFLSTALMVLADCRRTLKYTYVFAFYLKKNNQGEIFEGNQKDLENATELLSEYLEGDASADELQLLRQKVLDKTKYCSSRRQKLLEHVKWGQANKVWEYQPASVQQIMLEEHDS
eukprot:m.481836 g.481836  ORF g.481836 m.481836 type:complete len:517 (-) comp22339_c0_seq1:123-1673(-)